MTAVAGDADPSKCVPVWCHQCGRENTWHVFLGGPKPDEPGRRYLRLRCARCGHKEIRLVDARDNEWVEG